LGFNGNMYAQATEVITTQGDLRRGDSSGNPERLAIGSTGKVLQSNGTTESWETLTTADSVLTTHGDILYESASALARLGQSTNNYTLATKGSGANPAWQASPTSVLSGAQDVLYSSAANTLARLAAGTDGDLLTTHGTGSAPTWETPTGGSTLTKVTKDYTDVAGGSLTIYALPQDEALVNIFTDITTVWDGSTTAVRVGDTADVNGFSENADWTSLGLTDATRGAYVTDFKGMRSTSGSTNIVASVGSVNTQAGATADTNQIINDVFYKQITGLTSGAAISHMLWDMYNVSAIDFKWALYDSDANAPNNMLGSEVTAAMPAISNTYTTVEQATSGSPVVPADGIVWLAIQGSSYSYHYRSTSEAVNSYTHSINTTQTYATGFPDPSTVTGGGSDNLRAGVKTAGSINSTQGESDFYLQIAST